MTPSKGTRLRLPGLIDCHVHFREPGGEQKETMATGARSARAGGVFTVCDMPNTSPPTVTVKALEDKVRRAEQVKNCDIHFFFGATKQEHLGELRQLWTNEKMKNLKEKCAGLKIYMDHSTGDQGIEESIIADAFKLCAELSIPLIAHCEDPEINRRATEELKTKDITAHSLMRPPESEERAVTRAIELASQYGTRAHATHISSRDALTLIRTAKANNVNITCDVTPHHLFLTIEDYMKLGALAKMNPPLRSIRSTEHQSALWAAIVDGTIDCIASDHAPHTLAEKQTADPLKAPSGVPGVETMLPLLLTVAAGKWPGAKLRDSDFKLRIEDIVRLCFTNPNHIFSLGASSEERVSVDLSDEWIIRGKDLHSKCGWTPYEGWKVVGKITLLP
ncbi:MAG: dihydroorotase [Candidatus Peribacteraceae bacterium]|nr:dihydroorotase [Candidatus Peribacteraceae bacterium]